MKTKNFFYGAMMTLCAVVLAMMTSCNLMNGNNPSDPSSKPSGSGTEEAAKGAYAEYAYATTDQMIEIFYVKIEYMDGDGKMQTENVTKSSWGKRVEAKSLPVKFGMRVNLTMKGTVDQTKYKEILISYTASYISTLRDANGKSLGAVHKNANDVELTIGPNQLSEWTINYQKKPAQFWFEYDEKGNFKLSE